MSTQLITPGALVSYNGTPGIFLGYLNESDTKNVECTRILDPNSYASKLFITFHYNENAYRSVLEFKNIIFSSDCPQACKKFGPEHLVFLKILVNSKERILPRIVHPYFLYNDNFKILNEVFQNV